MSHFVVIFRYEFIKGLFASNNKNDFEITDNTSLVVITGTTMDHEVISEDDFKYVIQKAKEKDVLVFVDDASGARLRRAVYNQPTAIDLGADISVASIFYLDC